MNESDITKERHIAYIRALKKIDLDDDQYVQCSLFWDTMIYYDLDTLNVLCEKFDELDGWDALDTKYYYYESEYEKEFGYCIVYIETWFEYLVMKGDLIKLKWYITKFNPIPLEEDRMPTYKEDIIPSYVMCKFLKRNCANLLLGVEGRKTINHVEKILFMKRLFFLHILENNDSKILDMNAMSMIFDFV